MLKGKKFDASALTPTEMYAYPDRDTCVPRPRYMCTPTEVHAYPDRGTMTNRFFSEDKHYIYC